MIDPKYFREEFVHSLSNEAGMTNLFSMNALIPESGDPKYVDTFNQYCHYLKEQYDEHSEAFNMSDFELFQNGFVSKLIKDNYKKAIGLGDKRFETFEIKKMNILMDSFPDEILYDMCKQDDFIYVIEQSNNPLVINCLQTISKKGSSLALLDSLKKKADTYLKNGDSLNYENVKKKYNTLYSFKYPQDELNAEAEKEYSDVKNVL